MMNRLPQLTSSRPRPVAGFTLFETVVVVVLVGILAVSLRPKAPSTSSMTLDAQNRTLASNLQRAQLLALSGNTVLFCTTAAGATGTAAYTLVLGSSCPTNIVSTAVDTTHPVVVALNDQTGFATTSTPLSFNSQGRPTAAADFRLKSADGNSPYHITIDALSGLIQLVTP